MSRPYEEIIDGATLPRSAPGRAISRLPKFNLRR
jgi:hypothetical protein